MIFTMRAKLIPNNYSLKRIFSFKYGGVKVSTGILKYDKRVEDAPTLNKGARLNINARNYNTELVAA